MSVPEHGTVPRYRKGCKCGPCREAVNAARRHQTRMKAYGRWQPYYVDAGPARRHILALREQGVGYRRAARLADVPVQTVDSLLYGNHDKPPSRKIRAVTAAAILAVRPSLDDLPPKALVDAIGTVRRLRALVATGWSQQSLAVRLGMLGSNFRVILQQDRVTAATARAVRGLYDDLWDRPPPEGTHREKMAASRSRGYARGRGWAGPWEWDDDPGPHFIDDPLACPAAGWLRRQAS